MQYITRRTLFEIARTRIIGHKSSCISTPFVHGRTVQYTNVSTYII